MLLITLAVFLRADLWVKSVTAEVFCLLQTWGRFKVSRVFSEVWPLPVKLGWKTQGSATQGCAWEHNSSCHWGLCWVFGSPWSCDVMGSRRDRAWIDASPGRGVSICRCSRIWLRFGDWAGCVMPKMFLRKCLTLLKPLGWGDSHEVSLVCVLWGCRTVFDLSPCTSIGGS